MVLMKLFYFLDKGLPRKTILSNVDVNFTITHTLSMLTKCFVYIMYLHWCTSYLSLSTFVVPYSSIHMSVSTSLFNIGSSCVYVCKRVWVHWTSLR